MRSVTGCMSSDASICGSYSTKVSLRDEPLQGGIAGGDRTVGEADTLLLDACDCGWGAIPDGSGGAPYPALCDREGERLGAMLFNVTRDPEEREDLAQRGEYAELLAALLARVEALGGEAVAPAFKGADPRAYLAAERYGAWVPFVDLLGEL